MMKKIALGILLFALTRPVLGQPLEPLEVIDARGRPLPGVVTAGPLTGNPPLNVTVSWVGNPIPGTPPNGVYRGTVEWDSDLFDLDNPVVRGTSATLQYTVAGNYVIQGIARINGKVVGVATIPIRVGSARPSLTRDASREALFQQLWSGDE